MYLKSSHGCPKGRVTRDLLDHEWWMLVRSLLSLDVWMSYLSGRSMTSPVPVGTAACPC